MNPLPRAASRHSSKGGNQTLLKGGGSSHQARHLPGCLLTQGKAEEGFAWADTEPTWDASAASAAAPLRNLFWRGEFLLCSPLSILALAIINAVTPGQGKVPLSLLCEMQCWRSGRRSRALGQCPRRRRSGCGRAHVPRPHFRTSPGAPRELLTQQKPTGGPERASDWACVWEGVCQDPGT